MYKYFGTVSTKLIAAIILLFLFPGFNKLFARNNGSLDSIPGSLDSIPRSLDSIHGSLDSILSVKNLNTQDDTAQINDVISIKISSLKADSLYSRLYINGIKVNGLSPWKKSTSVKSGEKTVFFRLDNNVKNLVDSFSENKSNAGSVIPLIISTGNNSTSNTTSFDNFVLEVKQEINNAWIWVIAIIIFGIALVALWNNILKDDNNLYYSLARTQLFYWTLLFVMCYLYVCVKTGSLPDLPSSILAILGISVGTTAVSKVIDNKFKDSVPIQPGAKSEGWFLDILSDGSSINIQRFQNVVFNLVFGIIFIQRTITSRVLPSFDDNILLLLGLSSGTYAGLKLTEVTKDQNKDLSPTVNDPATSQPAAQPPQTSQPSQTAQPQQTAQPAPDQ